MKVSDVDKIRKLIVSLAKSELDDFIIGILTPKEIEEISTRIDIVRQLKKRIPQKEIANNLKIGVATVTRGSKELQKGRFSYITPWA